MREAHAALTRCAPGACNALPRDTRAQWLPSQSNECPVNSSLSESPRECTGGGRARGTAQQLTRWHSHHAPDCRMQNCGQLRPYFFVSVFCMRHALECHATLEFVRLFVTGACRCRLARHEMARTCAAVAAKAAWRRGRRCLMKREGGKGLTGFKESTVLACTSYLACARVR